MTNLALTGLHAPIGLAIDNNQGTIFGRPTNRATSSTSIKLGGSKNPFHTLPGNGIPVRDQLQNQAGRA